MKQLRCASIGCGVIANQLTQALEKKGTKLYSVANRTYDKALEFAKQYKIEKVYKDIDEIFLDKNVDIIYISTPHNTHISYLLKALENKKHVLCEKAITLNSKELELAIKTAKKNDVILAEAMTIYHMPIYKELNKIIISKNLGKLKFIQMNFGSYKDYDMNNRFFNKNLAGGALLDIGVYALSFCRWFLSSNPTQISSQVKYAPSGVDEQVGILLMNEENEMATISLTLHAKQPKRGMISFENGFIEIYDYPRAQEATITFTENGYKENLQIGKMDDALFYEVSNMEEAIKMKQLQTDETSKKIENLIHIKYTQDVMEIMTKLRNDWNLKYPEEE